MKKIQLHLILKIIFVVWFLYSGYSLLSRYGEVLPFTKTYFITYSSFERRVDSSRYLDELPKSAHDMKYYFYEGFFSDKSAFHVTFAPDDYAIIKAERLKTYQGSPVEGVYWDKGGSKQYLTKEFVTEHQIEFVEKVLPEIEYGNYYIVAYGICEDTDAFKCYGVLCNDESYEMVEFNCKIAGSW